MSCDIQHDSEMKHIIYFHGFGSSPNSNKVQELKRHYAVFAPQVPYTADEASLNSQIGDYLFKNAAADDEVLFVGTSLGGYWATRMANQWDTRAVVFNPAVDPSADLLKFVGENINYSTGEVFELTKEAVASFRPLSEDEAKGAYAIICDTDRVVDPNASIALFEDKKVISSDDHQFTDMKLMLAAIASKF